jgi:hypothetical protein
LCKGFFAKTFQLTLIKNTGIIAFRFFEIACFMKYFSSLGDICLPVALGIGKKTQ